MVVTISMAKKEPNRQFKQILPERNQTHQKNESTGSKIGSQGNLSYKSTKSISVESIAREYIDHFIVTQKFNKSADSEFQLVSLRDGKVTRTARFKQGHKGVEVFGIRFTVSLNNDDVVIFETHSVFEIGEINVSKSSITEDEAYTLVSNYLGSQSVDLKKSLQKQVIYFSQGVAKLVYQIDYQFKNGNGHWQFLIDANTGEVIRAADMLQYATAQASVFDPDPLTTSGQSYGGGYVDGNDQNTNQLSQELKNYSIDVLNQNGTYFLTGEWAQSVDIEAPSDGVFSQNTNDFRNNRGENSFEAVNIYYHISEFLSYLNNDLNLNVKPYQYSTGIKFDAHGANGEDQSYYSHSGYLVFGEGCVDDGEVMLML